MSHEKLTCRTAVSGVSSTRSVTSIVCLIACVLAMAVCSAPRLSMCQQFSGGGMRQDGKRNNASQSPLMEGSIDSLDRNSIVLSTQNGERRTIVRTDKTLFVRESRLSPDQLVAGDFIRVLGRRSENLVDAEMIIAGAGEAENGRFSQSRKENAGGFQQGPMSGDRPGAARSGGPGNDQGRPLMGSVVSVSPLIIRDQSGVNTTVRVGNGTRCVRESPASDLDVREGTFVRIVAPPRAGGGDSEARKVIIADQSNQMSQRREGSQAGNSSPLKRAVTESGLLPDLPQQPLTSDFLYGLWIGRGLFSNEELDRAFRVASNLGVRYVKIEVKWDYIEERKGRFQWNNQETLDIDHAIALARQYKMSLIPYFDMDMPWGETRTVSSEQGTCEGPSSRRGQRQAPDPQAYAEYVFAVVDRIRKGSVDVRIVELDNETANISDGYTSLNCFHNISARQLKQAHNAAYDKIKHEYPEVMVSSTTFMFPGMHLGPGRAVVERDVLRRNSYVKAYFGEAPKPKFDFLGLHEIISGSGNPFTSWDRPVASGAQYNFGSYHDAYDMWRGILDAYGYQKVPMIDLESEAVTDGLQDAEMIQRVVFARANASRNNVRGWVLAYLTPTRKFAEYRRQGMRIGITNLANGYELREGYAGFYAVMKILTRYPKYRGKVMGTVNGSGAWVESFDDVSGNVLYVAFLPFVYGRPPAAATETITLGVQPHASLTMTKSDMSATALTSDATGRVRIDVTHHPVFLEVKK